MTTWYFKDEDRYITMKAIIEGKYSNDTIVSSFKNAYI
jgi:hypothetical protein